MDTLAEVEAAVDPLSPLEQDALMRHLAVKVWGQQDPYGDGRRADWMRRLEALRASIGAPMPSLTAEQIIGELRGE